VSLPPAVSSLTLAQGDRWVWSQSTTDVRALQSPDQSMRRAATYYDPNEVRVVLSFGTAWSGNVHLYAVDFDQAGRRESITVGGQTTDLSSDFSQGTWVTVPVSVPDGGGSVTITVDRTAGPNAVLSGIFLGEGGPPLSPAWAQAPQGSWSGTFGFRGYDLAGWNGSSDAVSLPAAVSSLTLAQGHRWVWSQSTTAVRVLQGPDQSVRRAATYYDPNEVKVVLSFSTAWSANVHLYAVDFDQAGRRESITVGGQTTNLSSDFSQGAWVTVPVSVPSGGGSVTITVDRTAGPNAVLSGIFLGGGGRPLSATWGQAPQGSWSGTLGSRGYDLAGWNGSSDAVSLPAAVSSLTLAQGDRWGWSQSTTDVRALQSPDQSVRRAATYYDPNEVKVVLSFSTAWSGNLSLYAVDFDHAGRRESITVGGQTINLSSDFSQGAWVTVPVSVPSGGSITIRVDRAAGPNAVLSGIFFGDQHVMVIVEENHSYSDIIGNTSEAPYMNSLVTQYGLGTNWFGLSHPSEPNYLGMVSGSIWDNPRDSTPQNDSYPGPTVVDQMASAGIGWKAYMEDMPQPCDLTHTYSPAYYDVNHNPFMYFQSIRSDPAQCNRDVPFTQFAGDLSSNTMPPFVFISPNLNHDMHNGTIQQADTWLHSTMSQVFSSQWYAQGGIVIITWDEGESSDQIPVIVVDARDAGKRLTTKGDHYGMLRAIEEAYALPFLGHAADSSVDDLTPLF
jgi:acid phosphatase